MRDLRRLRSALGALGWLALSACVAPPHYTVPTDFAQAATAAEESRPVGGASLHQRQQQMRRMYRDLVHLRRSLLDSVHRGDRRSAGQLGRFCEAYLGLHLDPVLDAEWPSHHAELTALDADLRLLKADVLIRMDESGRAQVVIDQIAERFRGREDMLVDYPVGTQSPLAKALQMLRDGKWDGASG